MWDKVILENDGTLMFVPESCKNKKMCNKAADNYACVLEFVPDHYKTQKVCNESADAWPSAIQFVSDQYNTQEIYVEAVGTCLFCI